MEIERPIIKTYSKRKPLTKYVSHALLVPSHTNSAQVRESRLNDKTLVVDNFDDTFDRLATGVVIPSPKNSLDENGVAKRKDSDLFEVFKVPLQAKRNEKSKQKGKPKKNDLISKAAGVKRKKVVVASDDSDLSDQDEHHKKEAVNSDKKSKVKVKRVAKRKKVLSLAKVVSHDKLTASESADENAHNNAESNQKESTENNDNFNKLKERSYVHRRISDYFEASTPRVDTMQSSLHVQNISPVVMEKNIEKEKETVLHLSVQDVQAEKAVSDEQNNISENFNENVEGNQVNSRNETDNFAKPREFPKVSLLKTSTDLLTSTPRVNKIRMPVNLQHLSPIISNEANRASDNTDDKSSTVGANLENDQISTVEANFNDSNQTLHEQGEPSTKLSKIQQSNVEASEEPLSREKDGSSQLNQEEMLMSNIANEDNNQDEQTNGNRPSDSTVDNYDSLQPSATSNTERLLNKSPVVNTDLHGITRSYAQSPLLFDDSEFIQNEVGKNEMSKVVSEADKVDVIQINFSHTEENKESAHSNGALMEPPITKNKNLDKSTESSFYPDDWTNDYDSTYGYDQNKKNLEKDTTDSKLDEDENKNSTREKTNDTIVENAAEIHAVLNIDCTESQSIENPAQEKTQDTVCVEDNAIMNDKNETEHEEHRNPLSISNEDNHGSISVEKDNVESSQIIMEERQSYHQDKVSSLVNESHESITESVSEDLVRPSKRRKTDVQNEKEVIDESNKNIAEHISVSENINHENINRESTDNISLAESIQYDEIIERRSDRELRIVLSRFKNEEYESPILSERKTRKRKSAKRVSKISKDTEFGAEDRTVTRKAKQEKTNKPSVNRVTRRSFTEDKMRQLYVQYQCKEVTLSVVRLEDQLIEPPSRSFQRKSRENNIAEDNELDSSLTNGGLSEFLSKFNDPMKVTMRGKTQKKFDFNLAAITEDQTGQNSEIKIDRKVVTWGNDKRVTFNDFEENSEDTENNDRKSQPIFLKPGKSWARSLSIINHFHHGRNLDELAAGRENWRHSVQTVLNMQPEVSARGHSQNCEETRRESRVSRKSSYRESKSLRKSSIASNARFSIRIIPNGKRSTLTDDLMESQRISYVSDRSRASRKTSLTIRRDTLIETEDDLIKSAKDIILKRCKQSSYEPFDVSFPDSYIKNCRKIGEGVYGEVFLYESGREKSVIKIIPIEGEQIVNCEPQKKFHEILSEIIIAEELHKLRNDGEFSTSGFVEVNRIMCVIGKYPDKLIDLWYAYDEQKQSENDCPSMFKEDQLYIILELAHGGQDLEAYAFQNASESYAIFLQTALTLAIAERSLEFEHRDLHWGNLLVSKTEDKHTTYKLGSEEISLPTKGVRVAVIDFTLSRMSYQGCKIFNDLAADPTLFEAQGEYQFDIYRMMRDNVNNDWQQFNPFTNVLWMDYTLDKMITAVRYKKKTTKIHKSAIEDMKALRKEIMNYSSAFDFVTNCEKVKALFDST